MSASTFKPSIDTAKELFAKYNDTDYTFEDWLSHYVAKGYVTIQPPTDRRAGAFAAAEPMRAKIEDPQTYEDLEADSEQPDTWFIGMAIGDQRALLALLPFDLPWIAFCRRWKKTLKRHSFELFKRKVLA